jgi:hypothetical protein
LISTVRHALFAILVAACVNDAPSGPTSGPVVDTDAVDCLPNVTSTDPVHGATDVHKSTPIELTFSARPEQKVDHRLACDGKRLASTRAWDDDVVTVSSEDVHSRSECTLEVDHRCGPTTVDYTTAALPAVSTECMDGLYHIDLSGGRFVEPAGLGPLIQQQLSSDVLIQVSSADSTDGSLLIGYTTSTGQLTQDLCIATSPLQLSDTTDNPYFSVEALPLPIEDLFYEGSTFMEFELSGAFDEECADIVEMNVSGIFDFREEPDTCDILATLGLDCVACPTGQIACVDLNVDQLEATRLDAAPLTEVTQADVANNPDCDPQ